MALSPNAISVVKATAAAVAPHAGAITTNFYGRLFQNPAMYTFFNKANQRKGRQPQALADAVVAYASNIDNLGALKHAVPLMAHKHCALHVLPEHYQIVHDNLMDAIGDTLGDVVTPEIAQGWSEAVMGLAGILIDAEETLYSQAEAREGGWRGFRGFTVASKRVVEDAALFDFVAADGYKGGFDFTPGQYLSVRVPGVLDPDGDVVAPRHYTVTSAPGDDKLSIAVRRVDGGFVSNLLHDSVNEGSAVELTAPFGVFSPGAEDSDAHNSVLISAGIGQTPMLAFARALGKEARAVHVERSSARDVFGKEIASLTKSYKLMATDADGEPTAAEIVDAAGVSEGTTAYVCGPDGFMADVVPALEARGVAVRYENFGPRTKL